MGEHNDPSFIKLLAWKLEEIYVFKLNGDNDQGWIYHIYDIINIHNPWSLGKTVWGIKNL